ncbi:MAG: TetR family transcriptional regulator [Quadrisphaera sp.]
MRSGSTRDALVSAALRVVEAEGLPAATTRRVAAEAGLPLGTVHYWFADKRQLVAAVTDALLHEVRERAAGASDLRDAHHRPVRDDRGAAAGAGRAHHGCAARPLPARPGPPAVRGLPRGGAAAGGRRS